MSFPLAGLVSYWKLDEASGIRVDSHGTNHLTPINNPIGTSGRVGNACDFESSSAQHLSHADPTPLGDEDFAYTLWFKRESVGVQQQLIAKDTTIARAFYLQIVGNVQFFFGADVASVSSAVSVEDTTWHFLVAWHDAAANTINLQLDNGAVASNPTSGFFPPFFSTAVRIGAREYPGFGSISTASSTKLACGVAC